MWAFCLTACDAFFIAGFLLIFLSAQKNICELEHTAPACRCSGAVFTTALFPYILEPSNEIIFHYFERIHNDEFPYNPLYSRPARTAIYWCIYDQYTFTYELISYAKYGR
jgi:hypothetical protein